MSTSTSNDRKIEIFRTMARAWHEQDWDTCAGLFADNGVLHSVMLAPVVGRQAIHERISRLGAPNKKVTLNIQRIGVLDGVLIVQRVDEIVIDGKRGECPAMSVIEFDGDKIARWLDYYDRATLARAAGHTAQQEQH